MGGLDLWFTHMLTVGGRDLWFTHALNFVVKWTLEGTNATHNLPYRLHKSATPSPKATYTPNFQNPFRHACPVTVKNIGLKTIGQQNRDLTWWRFGFRVRENKSVRLVASSATGLKKKEKKKSGARPCTAKGCSHFVHRHNKQSSPGADPRPRPKI